jgi:thioredoxin reductase
LGSVGKLDGMTEPDFECVIVGGGAAGLSAALVLGRARRRVLLIDAGRQSNRAAPHVGGLLGHDGTPPDVLYRLARTQLEPYASVAVADGTVTAAERENGWFRVELQGDAPVVGERLLLASGMDYAIPELPGAAQLWGDTVFHCPFCHGWELRDRPLAILGRGEEGVTRAVLLRGWSKDVVLLTDGPAGLSDDQRARLAAHRSEIVERRVARLSDCSVHGGCGKHLESVVFDDGSELPRDGLLVAAPLRQRSALAEDLGARPHVNRHPRSRRSGPDHGARPVRRGRHRRADPAGRRRGGRRRRRRGRDRPRPRHRRTTAC